MYKQVDQRKFVVIFNTVDKLDVEWKIEYSLIALKVRNITPHPTMRQFCNRNVHMYENSYYKMVHCGIRVQCIAGFKDESIGLWREHTLDIFYRL